MSTEIKQYIRTDVLQAQNLRFTVLRFKAKLKAAIRNDKDLSLNEASRLIWNAKVIEPKTGEIRHNLYGGKL